MKLFVPPLKTELKLTSAWTFDLHHEHRNKKMFEFMNLDYTNPWQWRRGHDDRWGRLPDPVSIKLPKGTVLVVDRIYIRQQAEDFDSITFRIKSFPGKSPSGKKTARFWAKLDDCNGINVQVLTGEESPKEKI